MYTYMYYVTSTVPPPILIYSEGSVGLSIQSPMDRPCLSILSLLSILFLLHLPSSSCFLHPRLTQHRHVERKNHLDEEEKQGILRMQRQVERDQRLGWKEQLLMMVMEAVIQRDRENIERTRKHARTMRLMRFRKSNRI